MKSALHLRVITPSGVLFDVQDVAWVKVQLADGGGIGVWPGHAPLLAESVASQIVFATKTGEHSHSVGAGILLIQNNEVTLMTANSAPKGKAVDDLDPAGAISFERLAKVLYGTLGADLEQG